MKKRRKQTPGDFVYRSERKLYAAAAQQGLKMGALRSDVDIEGMAGAQAGDPSVAGLEARGTVRATYSDPAKAERLTVRDLDGVVRELGKLPDLEAGETIREGEWFRFHRDLRFGVGHSDMGAQIKALVVADREPVPPGLSVPGLMMNGSIAHVQAPYATDALRTAPGSRSGSGTDRLFNWLDEVRRAQEDDPTADRRAILDRVGDAPRGTGIALAMYRLFCEERWVASHLAEPLMHGAPCEGVAQASFIAVGDEITVVMGSPLYIRVCPLSEGRERSGGRFAGIFRRPRSGA